MASDSQRALRWNLVVERVQEVNGAAANADLWWVADRVEVRGGRVTADAADRHGEQCEPRIPNVLRHIEEQAGRIDTRGWLSRTGGVHARLTVVKTIACPRAMPENGLSGAGTEQRSLERLTPPVAGHAAGRLRGRGRRVRGGAG